VTREIGLGSEHWIAERSRTLRPGETMIAGIDATGACWHSPAGNGADARLARAPGRMVAVLHAADTNGHDVAALLREARPDTEAALTFLVPHGHRPLTAVRDAHEVHSFLCTPRFFQRHHARILRGDVPAYDAAQAALTDPGFASIRARWWPHASTPVGATPSRASLAAPVTWLVPHRGELADLIRCLIHLRRARAPQDAVWVCLDDPASPAHDDLVHQFQDMRFWRCSPAGVGPYVARHVLGRSAGTDILIFQDSDDLPLHGRRDALVTAVRDGGLDMVGSNELRVEERVRQVLGLRFPASINAALGEMPGPVNEHVYLHPTTAIRVAALRDAGGFSTVRTFAADAQFVLRSHFLLRAGNVGDFLYLRRKHEGRLSTSSLTGHGTPARAAVEDLWRRDFARVRAGEIPLSDSSLMPEHHPALGDIRFEALSDRSSPARRRAST
jgi:hypothetical protein